MERNYRENKTTQLFHNLDKVLFFCSSINFWVDDNDMPEWFLKAYQKMSKVLNVAVILFMMTEVGSFFTQHNLTDKQKSDRLLMTCSHIIIYSFTLSLIHQKDTVTGILYSLAVSLKKDFNDKETEKHMLKRTKVYTCALLCLLSNALIFYGVNALSQVLFSDGNFVTIITVWPDVHDQTLAASIGRVGIYVLWWLWIIRVTTAYLLVLIITISLSHQYRNLQMYFKSIEGIFDEKMSHNEKEEKYERALKLGIQLHATTIRCMQQVQKTCGYVFSGHTIVNTCVLVVLMSQLKHTDRSLSHVLSIVTTAMGMMFSTGVMMWNAGDITVEAANLPTAIYSSGWQNCTKMSSYRIRRLIVIAIAQSQKPVVIVSCGFIVMSYDSYVTIVKTSYSIFSVMY